MSLGNKNINIQNLCISLYELNIAQKWARHNTPIIYVRIGLGLVYIKGYSTVNSFTHLKYDQYKRYGLNVLNTTSLQEKSQNLCRALRLKPLHHGKVALLRRGSHQRNPLGFLQWPVNSQTWIQKTVTFDYERRPLQPMNQCGEEKTSISMSQQPTDEAWRSRDTKK